MIIDYRIYCTLYILCGLAWVTSLYPLSRAVPGDPTFRLWMDRSGRLMAGAATVAGAVATVNLLDWMWS